jgi:hypothetical protein
MLISDRVLFLHVPKTGGLSVSDYLVHNLAGPIEESLGAKVDPHAERQFPFADLPGRVRVFPGRRHEDLRQATDVLAERGRSLADFDVVLAVVRNPYDLEVSHFEHLRKPSVIERRGEDAPPVRAATSGDFGYFVEHAPFYGCLPARMERYYTLDGEVPVNLRLVRFEQLSEAVREAVAPYSLDRWPFPHVNASIRRPYRDYLTPAIEQAIYDKYRYLFEHYPREQITG